MKPLEEETGLDGDATPQAASALVDERKETDDNLERERELTDSAVHKIQRNRQVETSVREAMNDLRSRLRHQRQVIDRLRMDSRRTTDAALKSDQHSTTEDLNRAEEATESAKTMHHLERADAHRSLWSILAELDVIACSVQAIRLRSVDLPPKRDIRDLADAIEVASERVLTLVGDMLDPEDNQSRYHEIGGSG